jgi:ASC-1-like (ASCH) protein
MDKYIDAEQATNELRLAEEKLRTLKKYDKVPFGIIKKIMVKIQHFRRSVYTRSVVNDIGRKDYKKGYFRNFPDTYIAEQDVKNAG